MATDPITLVTGGKDGLVCDNTYNRKGEPLIDVAKLKGTYLFGVHIQDRITGEEMADDVFQVWIDNAVAMLESYLDISISPVRNFEEFKDYRLNDYADWGFFQMNNYPVLGIRKIDLVYFRDENGVPETVETIPNNWVRLQAHDGIVRLIPNARFPANLQISQSGSFFPEILRAQFVPHAWRFTYDYGFETHCLPVLLNRAIGTLAAIQALIIAGHLILGAGIAATSISLDGLAQSVQTTQSAENSGYSAVLKDFGDQLWGKTKDDQYSMLNILKNYYKGETMSIIA